MNPTPLEIAFAAASDVTEIASVLGEGAAWMALKGCPAWTPAMISVDAVGRSVARGEFVGVRHDSVLVAVCTLIRADALFWPEDPPGEAAYVHRLAVRRAVAGRRITPSLIDWCSERARGWGCKALRLDCHPRLRGVYEDLGFSYVDTRSVAEEGGAMIVDRLQRRL